MAIDLINPLKHKFGSVEWQDAMVHNITEKLKHSEELGIVEKCFISVQKDNNYRVCATLEGKDEIDKTSQELYGKDFIALNDEQKEHKVFSLMDYRKKQRD